MSGEHHRLCGELRAGDLGGVFVVGLVVAHGHYLKGKWLAPGTVLIVDPRCYVMCVDGRVHYDPWDYVEQMSRGMRKWLRDNPNCKRREWDMSQSERKAQRAKPEEV